MYFTIKISFNIFILFCVRVDYFPIALTLRGFTTQGGAGNNSHQGVDPCPLKSSISRPSGRMKFIIKSRTSPYPKSQGLSDIIKHYIHLFVKSSINNFLSFESKRLTLFILSLCVLLMSSLLSLSKSFASCALQPSLGVCRFV